MGIDGQLHVIIGTGALGKAIMAELVERGVKRIRLVNRTGKLNVALPKHVELVKGDASYWVSMANVMKGASVVYHAAQPPYTNWPRLFPSITRGIIEGAASVQAKLVVGDNLYMYGPSVSQLHEELPYAAKGSKGVVRANMAKELMEAHSTGRLRVAIGRASDFYGPHVFASTLGESVIGAAIKRKPIYVFGNVDVPHTYTYIGDFARGLVTLGEHEEAFGHSWHIPSAETFNTRDFLKLLFDHLGYEVKVRTTSKGIMSVVGLFNPMVRELEEVYYAYEHPYIVDHSKFAGMFDVKTTPHKRAIEQTVEWYRGL